MIKFKFLNATVEAPDCWEDVTVEMFCNPYFLTRDAVGILSVLTGIEKHVLMNTRERLDDSLAKMIKFIADDPYGYQKLKRKPIVINGITCKIPKDIELERLGQRIMFASVMLKHTYKYEGIAEVVAIYLIPELNKNEKYPDGEFNDNMMPDVTDQVKKLRIVDVYPAADFFLNN